MDELDRRLRSALQSLPEADEAARERAIRRAVALAPAQARRRPWRRRLTLSLCAAAIAIGTGAALAGTGVIDVRVGPPERTAAPALGSSRPLALPPGADGVAVVAGGRLFLRTRSGVGIEGLGVSTAELSPNSLYVAVGIGDSLAALSPSGRRAWVARTAGPVVAASWAPFPVWIAYIVQVGGGHELRIIEGDGDHDRLVAESVEPVRPYWSADGTRLYFRRRSMWLEYLPSVGSAPTRAAGCGEGCPGWMSSHARALLMTRLAGGRVVATTHTPSRPEGDAIAVTGGRGGPSLEVWWTPPATVGSPRLLMRAAARPGPVQISVR